MTTIKEALIPDLGGAQNVDVIEVFVKPGDSVEKDDSLITLEGEKASMEVPSPYKGIIKSIDVTIGERVSKGFLILTMEVEGVDAPVKTKEKSKLPKSAPRVNKKKEKPKSIPLDNNIKEVKIPALGTTADVKVIEVLISAGDKIQKGEPIIVLEGDKASMELPSPYSGEIKDVVIHVGDNAFEGALVLTMLTEDSISENSNKIDKTQEVVVEPLQMRTADTRAYGDGIGVYAGPGVRRFARELGIDLKSISGTGRKGRILKEDIQNAVKSVMTNQTNTGFGFAQQPTVDHSQFGEVEVTSMSKLKRLTGTTVHSNWITIPHVTQFDEADITEMEVFRKEKKSEIEKQGIKLTPLAFIMKAVVWSLKEFPRFNSSLDPDGEHLILKKYFHVGVAVDTPDGLVIPVIRDVEKKSLFELAKELRDVGEKTRDQELSFEDVQGSCFTISNLGGIGGSAFTPIVNLPEVAILGVSKSSIKPVYKDGKFIPRLMLPLSLSYDHRVIDGAEAARFMTYLTSMLADVHQLLL